MSLFELLPLSSAASREATETKEQVLELEQKTTTGNASDHENNSSSSSTSSSSSSSSRRNVWPPIDAFDLKDVTVETGINDTALELRTQFPQAFGVAAIFRAKKNKTLPLLSKQWLDDLNKREDIETIFTSAREYLSHLERIRRKQYAAKRRKKEKDQRSETLEQSEEEEDNDR